MPPTPRSTVAQITSLGQVIKAKNEPFTIKDVDAVILGNAADTRSAYLHVPFCFHKCHYCDFYSIVDNRDRQAEFVDRLADEINAAGDFLSPPMQTLFVGGGTPTLLDPTLWSKLLATINEQLPLGPKGEFTVEANPETVTEELMAVLFSGGVNRISIGCQSFNLKHLKTLERWHDPKNVHRSVELLRAAGIHNFNLDLIFAIPGQTLDEWLADLDEAIALNPAHISCYGLVYEHNTPLTVKMHAGRITPCEQDLEAQMYEATIERLAAAGFEHYEISNWARKPEGERHSLRCQHNMAYWTNRNWWPLGPSATGHVNALRWKNVARLGEYLQHVPLPPVVDVEQADEDMRIGEAFMLGLRLIEGMTLDRVDALLAAGDRAEQRSAAISRHIESGLLERAQGRLRLRVPGLMLADTVLAELI